MTIDTPPSQVSIRGEKKQKSNVRWILLVVVLCASVATYFMMAPKEKKEKKERRIAAVTVSTATLQDVPEQLHSMGSVTPVNSVNVKPRIGGRVVSIHFEEGQFVKKKDLLFTIDPRPLKAALLQAEAEVEKQQAMIAQAKAAIQKAEAAKLEVKANLERDLALAKQAGREAERFTFLAKAGAVSEADAERRETTLESTSAVVKAGTASIANAEAQINVDRANLKNVMAQLDSSKAALQNAKIQVGFTTVNAPISGRTGHIMVLKGNVVRADEDILVPISQIQPIYVEFAVPQEQFHKVQECSAAGTLKAAVKRTNGGVLATDGRLTFIDNIVDSTTGNVKLKAVFANADSKLWPGQYVDITLTLKILSQAVVVPTQAVQTGQQGQFIWVLDDEKLSHMRPVKIGPATNGLTVIESGIKAGDQVVTDGQIQLSEGGKVKISESAQ
ncbi:MAG: efflux RND transporter periplasmic adaptor subunit [Leptolyngbya sp.]|nr:efflux RND transporter periplasmic adaptor subunit [Candidatus Melainabacteria bacterium]